MRGSIRATACLMAMFVAVRAFPQDVYVTLVRTHFTVTNARGAFVTDLSRDDVTIYDNDAPQRIADFSRHVQAPLSVAVLLDRSQSVSDRFPLLLTAAAAFEQSVIRGPDDRGIVVAFDSKVYLLQDWTADPVRLADSVRRLTAAGGTSIFDALFKTCRDKFEISDTRQNVVVLITDGEDTTSLATFDQALQMARLARVAVYVVGIRAENSLNTRELQGRRVLSRLTELTGGRLFYPSETHPEDLGALFGTVQEELRSAYGTTYYLDGPPDNGFHRVRVETMNKALTVHAPTGYYTARPLPHQP